MHPVCSVSDNKATRHCGRAALQRLQFDVPPRHVSEKASRELRETAVQPLSQELQGLTGDPVIEISAEVTQQSTANAPTTSNLQNQLLPANTTVVPVDAEMTPITFGPRGLPCAPLAVTGGSVCDSSGGPVAYWVFFQNSVSGEWEALTVTPAGRIQKWYYAGTQWNTF